MKRDRTASRHIACNQKPAVTPVQFFALVPPTRKHTYIDVLLEPKTLKGVVSGT